MTSVIKCDSVIVIVGRRQKTVKIMTQVAKRRLVQQLYENGIREVQEFVRLTGLGKSTVYNVLYRIRNGIGMEHAQVSGRPRKIRGPDLMALLQLGRRNPRLGFRKLAKRFSRQRGIPVACETIRQAYMRSGYRARKPRKIPAVTEEQIRRRLQFCENFRNDNFENVFITDEACFQLGDNRLRILSRDRPTVQTSKFPTKIMVWGGISLRGATELSIIAGTVDSARYCTILNEYLVQTANTLYPEGWRLQQDNARCHTSRYTRTWLEDNRIETIPWPAVSPDLSPIENIWGLMKIEVERKAPRTRHELVAAVLEAWQLVTETYASNLLLGIPDRLHKCLRLHGLCISK